MGLTRRYFAKSDSNCLVGYQQDAALIVYKMQESVRTPYWRWVLHFSYF